MWQGKGSKRDQIKFKIKNKNAASLLPEQLASRYKICDKKLLLSGRPLKLMVKQTSEYADMRVSVKQGTYCLVSLYE